MVHRLLYEDQYWRNGGAMETETSVCTLSLQRYDWRLSVLYFFPFFFSYCGRNRKGAVHFCGQIDRCVSIRLQGIERGTKFLSSRYWLINILDNGDIYIIFKNNKSVNTLSHANFYARARTYTNVIYYKFNLYNRFKPWVKKQINLFSFLLWWVHS